MDVFGNMICVVFKREAAVEKVLQGSGCVGRGETVALLKMRQRLRGILVKDLGPMLITLDLDLSQSFRFNSER